ncbi:methionine--tRNA ligase [Micromonospora sp. KC606]|uniref:class I tRNA ligase family protein n=1 Tax=Micromonospora sp. KC606 TaxID=2530379 RepID=UPI001051C104|nr:class I tRNA ligase family protein [Micromonospora sp. KC606]TDC83973.1 methionine--tRNA ligase [Micromonospora sp. KC606]
MTGPFWITATPPTPNGELHVGHLAGPYLAADVLRRFLSAEGHTVRLTTGLDDHQSYVPVRGLRDGLKGEEVADRYGAAIVAAWTDAATRYDPVVRPRSDPGYTAFVQEFFAALLTAGAIVPRTRPLPWCDGCERWLYEAYVAGGCPHCGAESGGNACEACGRPNECGDLRDPHCVVCGTAARLRDCERLYLPLAPFADRLASYWAGTRMPPHLRALCEVMLAGGLPEIAVSHPSDWGVPVPAAGFEDQRVYVWFEMAPGYLLQHPAPRPAPVQFFGFDNGYFHAVLFPALFMAYDPGLALPSAFVVNEFYRLSGKKFSTSRRHAVWASEALARVGADVLRWHVFTDRPTGRQTNFEPADLDHAREHLHQVWNGWLDRLLADVREHHEGRAPRERPDGAAWQVLHGRVLRAVAELREAYAPEGFDPRRAVALLDEIVAMAVDFGHEQAHERARPAGTHAAAVSGQLAVAALLAAAAEPVLPDGAVRLAHLLGVDPGRPVDAAALQPLPPAHPIRPADGAVFGRPPALR